MLNVEGHRAVDDSGCVAGVVFQVRIVRRNHTEAAFLLHAFEDRFGNRSSDDRLGSRSEFIDQYE